MSRRIRLFCERRTEAPKDPPPPLKQQAPRVQETKVDKLSQLAHRGVPLIPWGLSAFAAIIGGGVIVYRYSKGTSVTGSSTSSSLHAHLYENDDVRKIDRSELKNNLKKHLQEAPDGTFTVLTGPSCSGKTYLLHEAVAELANENVPGIICVAALGQEPIAHELARALDLTDVLKPRYLSLQSFLAALRNDLSSNPLVAFRQIFLALPKFARKFAAREQKDERCTTIVIDNVDQLVSRYQPDGDVGLKQLLWLEEKARAFADMHNIRIIFVDSSGAALEMFNKNPSFNTKMRVFFLDDVADDKAKEYLTKNLKDSNVPVEKAFSELTGGRVGLMRNLVQMARDEDTLDSQPRSYEDVRSKFLNLHGKSGLHSLDLLRCPAKDEPSKRVFQRYIILSLFRNNNGQSVYDMDTGLPYDEAKEAIDELIRHQVVRYKGRTTLALHNQAVVTAISQLDWIRK